MTADFLRLGRQELLALAGRIAELETENARLTRDHGIMLETLTHAQARGSELQDEARALRRVLRTRLSLPTPMGVDLIQRDEQFEILVDLLKVRWRGDAKYGTAEAHADLPLGLGNPVERGTRVAARRDLEEMHAFKKTLGGKHSCWAWVIEEEWLELLTTESEDRAEAEALDLANVCLKMVEAIRIRRARGAK
jgi:hypothetical protein